MAIERLFSVFRTAARGLEAQRIALGTSAENIANANTSRTADGSPYALKRAVHRAPNNDLAPFYEVLSRRKTSIQPRTPNHRGGANLTRLLQEGELGPETTIQREFRERLEYDPSHPDADENGYVHYPDVNLVEEMTRMISANRLYEANLTTVEAAKEMFKRSMEI